MTTPLTTPSSKPRRLNSCRSSTATSSAVHSRRDVTRQSAARCSPSNRASVTLVLPTSMASSTGGTLLTREARRVRFSPAPQSGRLAAYGPGSRRDAARVRAAREIPHQVLGGVGGEHSRVGRRFRQPIAVEREPLGEQGRRLQALESVLHGGEQGRLVLLKIAVVGEGHAFQDRGQRDQASDGAARPP